MKSALIACNVYAHEIAAIGLPDSVDSTFFPMGIHNRGADFMRDKIQQQINTISPVTYDAIILGYGLCGNGIIGIAAGKVPLWVPRVHDCIALLLGGNAPYLQCRKNEPATWFQSPGWVDSTGETNATEPAGCTDPEWSYDTLLQKYGKEKADLLAEKIKQMIHSHSRMLYIRTGVPKDADYELRAKQVAKQNALPFEQTDGDLSLLRKLLLSKQDTKELLLVPPGFRIVPTYDERVIIAEPVS
jgi:hypothetical protein